MTWYLAPASKSFSTLSTGGAIPCRSCLKHWTFWTAYNLQLLLNLFYDKTHSCVTLKTFLLGGTFCLEQDGPTNWTHCNWYYKQSSMSVVNTLGAHSKIVANQNEHLRKTPENSHYFKQRVRLSSKFNLTFRVY